MKIWTSLGFFSNPIFPGVWIRRFTVCKAVVLCGLQWKSCNWVTLARFFSNHFSQLSFHLSLQVYSLLIFRRKLYYTRSDWSLFQIDLLYPLTFLRSSTLSLHVFSMIFQFLSHYQFQPAVFSFSNFKPGGFSRAIRRKIEPKAFPIRHEDMKDSMNREPLVVDDQWKFEITSTFKVKEIELV